MERASSSLRGTCAQARGSFAKAKIAPLEDDEYEDEESVHELEPARALPEKDRFVRTRTVL